MERGKTITTDIEIIECVCRNKKCSAQSISEELDLTKGSGERGLNRLRNAFNMTITYSSDRFGGKYVIEDWGDFTELADDVYERLKSIQRRLK